MPLSPLLPIAAGAVAPLAARAMERLSAGLSFAKALRGETASTGRELARPDAAPRSPETDGASPGAAARLRQARQTAQETAERFQHELQRRLAEAGIDLARPISLESNGRGAVLSGGDHPQRAAIEQVFADHPELAETFHQLLAEFQLLRRLESPVAADRALADPARLRVVMDAGRLDVRAS